MATQPKRARVAAYVELVGGADHCETCLLVVVARLSSDVERTREACYAFRCGEGSGRLLGACGVSTAGLRAVCCLDAGAGRPELALNHRSAGGAALAVVCGCDDARRVAAAAVAATSPGCGAEVTTAAYADDHVTIDAEPDGRGAARFRVVVRGGGGDGDAVVLVCPGAYDGAAAGSRSTGAAPRRAGAAAVVDYGRDGSKRGLRRANEHAARRAAFFPAGAVAAALDAEATAEGVLRVYAQPAVVVGAGDYDAESPARLFARCRAEAAAAAAVDDAADDDAPPERARGSSSIPSEAASEPGDGPATKLLFLGTGSCGGSSARPAPRPRSAASTRSGSRTRTSTTAAACPPSSPRRWRRGDGGATPRTPRPPPRSAAARRRRARVPGREAPRRRAAAGLDALRACGGYEGDCALRELAGPAASLSWGPADFRSVRVNHCRDAYAVVLTVGGARVAYSGDCRPSDAFAAAAARGFPASACEVLIHEATFDDGDLAHAVAKRHSTVSEALDVAKRAKATTCVLTHFSQRYGAMSAPAAFDGLTGRSTATTTRGRGPARPSRFRESAAVAPVDGGDPLAAALLAFYGARAPDRVADVARVLPLFRRNPAVMNGKLLRKYGAALPEDALRAADAAPADSDSDDSDDGLAAALRAPGGFAALAAAGDDCLPPRPAGKIR
ncbi:3'-tRNA processing endoribonuclease [Aureococcus anophagefferens]|nr:3'-tRNA processing endoribonuclease [Aureococcus anophagefferens]